MLSALNDAGAEYLVVGAYALLPMAIRGRRATSISGFAPLLKTPSGSTQLSNVSGIPKKWVQSEGELTDSDAVFRFGVPPERIDILTSITGIDFDSAWAHRELARI